MKGLTGYKIMYGGCHDYYNPNSYRGIFATGEKRCSRTWNVISGYF
ncbi:hypothetical protein RZN22_11810 [Bacillaceae bacterium S4-13-58]